MSDDIDAAINRFHDDGPSSRGTRIDSKLQKGGRSVALPRSRGWYTPATRSRRHAGRCVEEGDVMRTIVACMLGPALLLLTGSPGAQELYVYPAKGQSGEQMARDKEECHDWAVKQTGVDPAKMAADVATPPASGATGAAGGAAMGAARGALSGDAAAGAVHGAGIGRLVQAIRARRQMQEQHEASAQAHDQRQAQLQKYDRALGACLTGRGYTVQ
jgi:hypothetical protein